MGSGGAGGAVDHGMISDVYPAPHPAAPQVVSLGGSVLHAPKFVPVFFANDDAGIKTSLKDYNSKIGATDYRAANVAESGGGAGGSTDPIELTEDAPASIDDGTIQTWLAGKLNGEDPLFPVNDANTVYVLHYPATSTIDLGGGDLSCQSFGGYHSNTQLDASHRGADVAYAVIPRCATFGDLVGVDAVTGAESHELIEASTDPYPNTTPAFAQLDNTHIYWERFLVGGETGDMCAQFPGVFTKFAGLDYTVQRTWSDKAAKAGHDPCVPNLTNQVYFNTVPELNDTITASLDGQTLSTKGVKIEVSETKDVVLDLFSDGPTNGPWEVNVQDLSPTPKLQFDLERSSGQNGEKIHLGVTVKTAGKNKTETFIVSSTLGGSTNLWVGIVGTPGT